MLDPGHFLVPIDRFRIFIVVAKVCLSVLDYFKNNCCSCQGLNPKPEHGTILFYFIFIFCC